MGAVRVWVWSFWVWRFGVWALRFRVLRCEASSDVWFYMCIYICRYYWHASMFVYVRMYVRTYLCMHGWMDGWMCARTSVCIYVCTYHTRIYCRTRLESKTFPASQGIEAQANPKSLTQIQNSNAKPQMLTTPESKTQCSSPKLQNPQGLTQILKT